MCVCGRLYIPYLSGSSFCVHTFSRQDHQNIQTNMAWLKDTESDKSGLLL